MQRDLDQIIETEGIEAKPVNNDFFGQTSFWNSQNGYELQQSTEFPEPSKDFVQYVNDIQGPDDLKYLGFETILVPNSPVYINEEIEAQNTHSGSGIPANEPEPDYQFLQTGEKWGFLKNIVNIDRFFDSGVHA
jgi:kynurenine formamidase